MDVQEFADQYRHRSDDELIRLSVEQAQLTDEARLALSNELSLRGLSGEKLNSLLAEDARVVEEEKRQAEFQKLQGVKRRCVHYGKADTEYNPETRVERYTTTFYLDLARFPLIPMGTYRVERRRSLLASLTVLEKLPLNWDQVLTAWVIGGLVMLILIWALKLFTTFSSRIG